MLFVSYSGNKFSASSILFNVCHSSSITICWLSSSRKQNIHVYAYHNRKNRWYDTIAIYQKYCNFFYLPELISIIFVKIFAFKVIMYDVLLKFNVMKCIVSSHMAFVNICIFPLYSNCAIGSKWLVPGFSYLNCPTRFTV